MKLQPSALLILVSVWLTACGGGPVELIPGAFALPGGKLSGKEGVAASWGSAAAGHRVMDLETRPEAPYSVRVGFVLRDGDLYIDPAKGRRWYPHLETNPSVRVRLGDTVYRARAVQVTDPAELAGFDPERHVFRLELVR
jgi:hypothetical protein